eukprot:gene18981-biopygen20491
MDSRAGLCDPASSWRRCGTRVQFLINRGQFEPVASVPPVGGLGSWFPGTAPASDSPLPHPGRAAGRAARLPFFLHAARNTPWRGCRLGSPSVQRQGARRETRLAQEGSPQKKGHFT